MRKNDDGSWHSSRLYNRNYNQQRYNTANAKKYLEEQRKIESQRAAELQKRLGSSQPQPQSIIKQHSRNKYSELWDECETLSSLLEENDIDHDDLTYPMDYYDLKDLRDEYESLLEENGIDY